MKKFRITLFFETDDDWTEKHIKEMFEGVIDSAYQLDDICVGELNVEEREVEGND